ncbi:MAG: hypothetical protein NTY22_09335 [Proteobacteria bacterium]|nr:hypothetical protein [Pseudomonadota bacterium]
MKNMKKLAIIVSTLAVILAGCSKGEYQPLSSLSSNTTTTTTTTTVDPITKFNTVWATTDAPTNLNTTHLRTLANFLGYNTGHYASTGVCLYGYKAVGLIMGDCYAAADILRNYFKATATYYQAFPAPKDLGSVSYYKIRFAANVDASTRKLTAGSAYLDISVETAADSFAITFPTVKTSLNVTNNLICTDPDNNNASVACDKISVTFTDECGDITLKADVIGSGLKNSKLTFLNKVSSYKNAGCYFDMIIPLGVGSNTTIPATAPEGIHTDSTGTKGELFQIVNGGYTGIPSFVEQ